MEENENFDIFNLDNESFVKQEIKTRDDDEFIYKPYPELGKDGVYKSLIRFLPNITNPKKSKIHQYYVWLKDPVDGANHKAICPSTVGKKSILKDLFWKLKNSASAKDQDLSKSFSRKEDFYSLIQVVKDSNRPDLEGKIMIFKFGRKVNDMIEQQIKPEFGNPSNPYDLCQFVGDKMALIIDGESVERTEEGREIVTNFLNTGPLDIEKYDYSDWDDEENEKIMRIIRNTIPDGRMVSEIIGTSSDSKPVSAPASVDSFYEDANSRTSTQESNDTEDEAPAKPAKAPAKKSAPSLDDLYNDL
jgi:hypothetical protein